MKKKEAIILAGGFGTRLREVVADVPKPMAPVNGRPFLEYLLSCLKKSGFSKIILSTGYLSEKISSYFGPDYEGMKLVYAREEKLLGTGGALKHALGFCGEQHVLVLNGDSFFDIDLLEFELFHLHFSGMFTIAVRQVENAGRYGTIEVNEEEIIAFKEKTGTEAPGLINGGVYYVDNYFFMDNCPEEEAFSLEKDFLEKNVDKFGFFAFISDGYFIDIGVPEDYKRAQDEFKEFKY